MAGLGRGGPLLALAGAWLIVFARHAAAEARWPAPRGDIGRGQSPAPLPESGPARSADAGARLQPDVAADLARLDEDRALILAGISHDLRTPLTRLRLADRDERRDDDATRERAWSPTSRRWTSIIGQFLDFARADAANRPEPTDLAALAREELSVEPLQRRRRVASRCELADVPPQPLRPLAIRRLIGNLIDNALRHGGAASRRSGHAPRRRQAVLLEVLDRGPGIPVRRSRTPQAALHAPRDGAHRCHRGRPGPRHRRSHRAPAMAARSTCCRARAAA
jgi:two-component system osmolarity sensor histidine kinase EnvZ